MQPKSPTSRRSACGCLIVLALLVVLPTAYSRVSSPVERALVRELCGRAWLRNAILPFGHHDEVPVPMSLDAFEAAARRVAGWDLMIVLSSYGSGSDVLDHPALAGRSSDLRYEISHVDGYLNERVYTVLVIRDERIVETFHLTIDEFGGDGISLVLSRDD